MRSSPTHIPPRRVTRGTISTWALTGSDLARVRAARHVPADRVAVMMHVSPSRVDNLERQEHVQAATARRYLDAVEAAYREPVVVMSAEDRQAWNERRDAERERARKEYAEHQHARDERHDHEETWRAFAQQFKRNPIGAFGAFCLEATDDVQPDDVGDQVEALFAQLARDHHVTRTLADLARELEARGLLVRVGWRQIVMQVAAPRVRGQRQGPPRLDAGRVPVFAVHCRLSDFGRWLVQAREAVNDAVWRPERPA